MAESYTTGKGMVSHAVQLRFSIGGIAQRTVSPGPADRFVLVAAGVSLVVEEEPASSSLPAPPKVLVADEVDLVLLKLSP